MLPAPLAVVGSDFLPKKKDRDDMATNKEGTT